MKKKTKGIEGYIKDAIENIENDRGKADFLLAEMLVYLKQDPSRHERSGIIAAKYLETLQRSNEQLVKTIELMRKSAISPNEKIEDEEIEDIYDELQGK
jgi:hypothetical protein